MRIIPAIDIMGGRCIRLTKGDFAAVKNYYNDPLELSRTFEDHGLQHLHLVDLDGAREKKTVNWKTLESIANGTSLKIDFGGGLKTEDEIRTALNAGASMVNIGSSAVIYPDIFLDWINKFGTEKIILAADADERKIKVSGWVQGTDIDVIEFIRDWEKKGISYVSCTDISRDGTLEGPSADLYSEIMSVSGVKLIASGGISSINDVMKLRETGCFGAIIGKAIYEGNIKLSDLSGIC